MISTLRNFQKNTVSKVENNYNISQRNKQFFFSFYYDYFSNIMLNFYTWENLPPSIDPFYLEKQLIFNGHVAFFKNEELGLLVQGGAFGQKLDIYNNPLAYQPVNNSFKKFGTLPINWYSDIEDQEKAIIIGNNQDYKPTIYWLHGFCEKLADIEQTIQLNRNAQIKPFIILADKNLQLSMKNLTQKMLNQDPVIYLDILKNRHGDINGTQIADLVQTLNINTPFLLDKLQDEKQAIISQILTFIGINNNAVDKSERLVKAEATSNNGLINASIEVGLKARMVAVEKINKTFNLNIRVRPSERIEQFNTEVVNDELINFGNEKLRPLGDDTNEPLYDNN